MKLSPLAHPLDLKQPSRPSFFGGTFRLETDWAEGQQAQPHIRLAMAAESSFGTPSRPETDWESGKAAPETVLYLF